MSRKERIKELETQLRIINAEINNIVRQENYSYHSRHNKFIKRYADTLKELESISIKWKTKKIIRRIKKHG